MQVYYNLQNYTPPPQLVLTIGSFDGLHTGHTHLLNHIKTLAAQQHGTPALLTFEPHPRIALRHDAAQLRLLTTLPEKLNILKKSGIQMVFVQTFDADFYSQTADEYIQNFLIKKIGAKQLVVGYDHRFGANGSGNTQLLATHAADNFTLHEIPAHVINENAVSSTKIRNYLITNQLYEANQLLGYHYQISGNVIQGNQLGRTIGFPTANIKISDAHKLIPNDGIYAVRVLHDSKYYGGMMYIGDRPTIENIAPEKRLEVVIFDFDAQIYGDAISVELIKFLRHDQKFADLTALKNQLHTDQQQALACLAAF